MFRNFIASALIFDFPIPSFVAGVSRYAANFISAVCHQIVNPPSKIR
jgi:hypothetical protein